MIVSTNLEVQTWQVECDNLKRERDTIIKALRECVEALGTCVRWQNDVDVLNRAKSTLERYGEK